MKHNSTTNKFTKVVVNMMITLGILAGTSNMFAQDSSGELIKRSDIDKKYTWSFTDIYPTDAAWEADFNYLKENYPKYSAFEGTLGNSAEAMLKCIKFDDELNVKLQRIYLYASLIKDIDLANAENSGRYDRVMSLNSKMSAASAFMAPEVLAIDEDKLWGFVKSNKELSVYKKQFDDLLRTKDHTLSKDLEEVMALASPVGSVALNTFGVFKNAEMEFPTVKDENGNDFSISDGRYYAALYSTDREYRERVYKGYYVPFMKYKNTFASLFNGNIKAITFNARARKYSSNREAALNPNNIPLSVYDNLVNSVSENLAPLNRWCSLKKKVLKVKKMHAYDTYVTLFPSVKKDYTFDQGIDILLDALKPLGEDYLTNLKKAFDNRWIDVYETKGKRSGAYSSGASFGVHPYVLLNWNNQINDVFTFAHEMGHNMHSYYTGITQPFPYADYSIFVAEVASTMNEALLTDYLIENAKTKEEKLALIESQLNAITTTFYRQTRFAAFESKVHEMSEKGEALTPDKLSEMYGEMYQAYWGKDMQLDEEEKYTWARIPHFYYNFYVYQYATSFAASQALAAKVKAEGQPAIDKFLTFLKAGSSDYPIEVLKKAGVDMNSPEPIMAVVKRMNDLLDQMEVLLEEE